MTQPHMDRNRMAALLDGRLSDRDRDDAVARLSASDDDAGLFADAAAILRELEAEDGVAADDEDLPAGVPLVTAQDDADAILRKLESDDGTAVLAHDAEETAIHPATDEPDTGRDGRVVPLRPPSAAGTRPRRMPARWLALAAVLAGVLLVPLALSRTGGRGTLPGDYAAILSDRSAGLPEDWTPAWSGTRGGEDASVLDSARSARMGALHVDLALAISARQVDETRSAAAQIIGLLRNVPASGVVIPYYSDIDNRAGAEPAQLADALDDAEEAVTGFVDADYFTLGAWAEAARLAAAREDAAFFASKPSRQALEPLTQDARLPEPVRQAAERVRRAVLEGGTPDWSEVSAATRDLVATLAR